MQTHTPGGRDSGFLLGLIAGTVIGAGLTMWLAPRSASELRQRVAGSARSIGKRASDEYRRASAHVAEAADALGGRGRDLRDNVAATVARAAHEVERQATAVRSKSGGDDRLTPTAES